MNILQMEDMVKGMPDEILMREAQMPSGQIPQFLSLSEIQRRKEMRDKLQAPPQATVADQILQGGIAAAMPQQPPQGGMGAPQGPPMGPPMGPEGAPVMAYGGGQMPYRMYGGGQIPYRMSQGRQTPTESEIREALSTFPRNRTPRQTEIARAALSSSERNPIMGRLYSAMYGNPQMPGAELAAPQVAPAPMIAPPVPPVAAPQVLNQPVSTPVAPPVATPVAPPAALPSPQAGFIAPDTAGMLFDEAISAAQIPAEPPAAPQDDILQRIIGRVPSTFSVLQGLMPEMGGMPNPMSLYPTAAGRVNPEAVERYENLIKSMEETGRSRRAEDIDIAKKAREEAEGPIRAAREEARRAAISSALMRLGAGLMAGKPEEGMASAAESVDTLMTRAREQEAADRRAINQEYRQAEREAVRGERGMADNVFRMQAQRITDDRTEQRELVRDQQQFAQWAFGQMRDQGRDTRQAYMDSVRLSLEVPRIVESALSEEMKSKRISKDQYTNVSGALLRTVNETLRQNLPENINLSTPEGRETLNDMAIDLVKSQLAGIGISRPDSENNVTVTSFEEISPTSLKVNGQTINFKNQEQADAFKKSIGR